MKKDSGILRNNRKTVLLMAGVILVLILLFRFDFTKRIDHQVKLMTTSHLADISSQSVKAIEKELEGVISEVQYTAEYLSQMPDLTEEERQLLYSQLKEKCGFANIRLISPDRQLYSLDYQLLPKSVGGYVEAVMRGESGMTDVFISSTTGEEIFGIYAPVIREGKPVGGIAGIMIVDQMIDIVAATGFDSSSYSYILKPDGTIVIQTSHPDRLCRGRDYLKFLSKEAEKGEEAASRIRSDMEQRKSGVFFYQIGQQKRMAYYEPTAFNDWYVMTAVSTKVTSDYVDHINRTAIYLTVKVVFIFILLAVLIIVWSQKTRRIILDSKEELELEKKKLELALRHSTNTIFEYRLKEDCLTFITVPEIRGVKFPQILHGVSVNTAGQGLISPEYVGMVLSALKHASNGKRQETVEFSGGSSFEEEAWFKLSVSPVTDGRGAVIEVIGTMEDITEEKSIRQRFAQEEQYRAALLSEAVAMWSVDLIRQQVIACTLLGKDQMKGRKNFLYSDRFIRELCQTVHSEERQKILKMIQVNNMLAAYYVGTRELKELFRVIYPGVDDYKWVTCTISLITEPTTGNPVAFTYVRDVDEETKREMELAYSSERDPLTGLYNRRNIAQKVEKALKEEGSLSCLMMMDLDGFKKINDRYGHQEGDAVLKKIAAILSKAFRADDLVARFGGDEFVVFLPKLPDRERASVRAEGVRSQVYEMILDENHHDVSISIGIAFGPEDGDTFEKLYQCADEALYRAKRAGKNQIKIYGKEEE